MQAQVWRAGFSSGICGFRPAVGLGGADPDYPVARLANLFLAAGYDDDGRHVNSQWRGIPKI